MREVRKALASLLLTTVLSASALAQKPWLERTLRFYPLSLVAATSKVGYLHGLTPNWSLSASASYSLFCLRNSNRPTMSMVPVETLVPVGRTGFCIRAGLRRYDHPPSASQRGFVEVLLSAKYSFSENYIEYISDSFEPTIYRSLLAQRAHLGAILQTGFQSTQQRLRWEAHFGVGFHQMWNHYSVLSLSDESLEGTSFSQPGSYSRIGFSLHMNFDLYLMFRRPESGQNP